MYTPRRPQGFALTIAPRRATYTAYARRATTKGYDVASIVKKIRKAVKARQGMRVRGPRKRHGRNVQNAPRANMARRAGFAS
jgi:hypothetical protein